MVPLHFISLFIFSHGGNWNQQGGGVPFGVACSPLAALLCGWGELRRNEEVLYTTLKKKIWKDFLVR